MIRHEGGLLLTLYAIYYARPLSGNMDDWFRGTSSPWRNIEAATLTASQYLDDTDSNSGTLTSWDYSSRDPSDVPHNTGWRKALLGFIAKNEERTDTLYTAFDTFIRSLGAGNCQCLSVSADLNTCGCAELEAILPTDANVKALAKPTERGVGVDTKSGVCGRSGCAETDSAACLAGTLTAT